jgi:hypothetical protein
MVRIKKRRNLDKKYNCTAIIKYTAQTFYKGSVAKIYKGRQAGV